MKLHHDVILIIKNALELAEEEMHSDIEVANTAFLNTKAVLELIEDKADNEILELKAVQLIPKTADLVLNVLIDKLLPLLEDSYGEVETIELENATWQYLKNVYKFEPSDHQLLKFSTEEALTFAIRYLRLE